MQINKSAVAVVALLLAAAAFVAFGAFHQFYISLLVMTQEGQRLFHDQITGKLRLIKETHSLAATSGLVLVGFLYGALHAIGPGHGKIIVGSYLLASKSCLKRGIIVTLLSSLLQACVAIALVFGLMAILDFTRAETEQTALRLENISFGLIILVGAGLMARGGKELWQLVRPAHHHNHHEHEHCGCGHAHAPAPAKLNKVHDAASLAGMVFSIGLRPCSGAVLLLVFSGLVGVYGAGVLATFAMALGTALTTGGLAVLTVQSKKWALRVTDSSGEKMHLLHAGLGLAGGLLIILFGTAFLSTNAATATQSDSLSSASEHPLMKGLYHRQ